MEEQNEIGWADFPCGNHSRNLHFDAFIRNFATYIKESLGPALEVVPATYLTSACDVHYTDFPIP
jgi:hypothetical protein